MTAGWRETVTCPNCSSRLSTEPPWKAWIRMHDDLDSRDQCLCMVDSDLWVQRYGTRRGRFRVDRDVMYLMLVEVKSNAAEIDDPQRDLLHIVNQVLRTVPWKEQRDGGRFVSGHRQNVRPVSVYSAMAKRWVTLHCYGVHKLRMSGATPVSSAWLSWDDKRIDVEQLTQILRYELSPDTLRPLEHRSHKRRDEVPGLLGIAELLSGQAHRGEVTG